MKDKLYFNIFEQSPIAIELYDAKGKLIDANRSCLDLFGVKNIDVIKGFSLCTDPNLTQQSIIDMKAGKSVKYELKFDFELVKEKKLYETSREGTCYLECYINPTSNKKGELKGFILHIIEITDRKLAEILLKKQTKELQDINAAKDKFFSIIGHDLKNPFSAIVGFSELLLKNIGSVDDKMLHKGLTTIESAAVHAYKLLENLLEWAQHQTGQKKFAPEVVNLKTSVLEIIKTYKITALNKNIRITTNIRKNLPVLADKNMLDTILRNLVSNAIKYSHNGGKVNVSASNNNNNIEISISDNGIGIPQEKLSAIFEIDKKTSTLGTAHEQGTGLGLILCKDFMDRHDGELWVESSPGQGSKFTFRLPLHKE